MLFQSPVVRTEAVLPLFKLLTEAKLWFGKFNVWSLTSPSWISVTSILNLFSLTVIFKVIVIPISSKFNVYIPSLFANSLVTFGILFSPLISTIYWASKSSTGAPDKTSSVPFHSYLTTVGNLLSRTTFIESDSIVCSSNGPTSGAIIPPNSSTTRLSKVTFLFPNHPVKPTFPLTSGKLDTATCPIFSPSTHIVIFVSSTLSFIL